MLDVTVVHAAIPQRELVLVDVDPRGTDIELDEVLVRRVVDGGGRGLLTPD